MCWSAEVSIKTWYFAVAGLLIGLYGGFPMGKLIFAIVFSSMQLVEYYLWKNLKNPVENQRYTLIGMGVILAEPLAALLLVPDKRAAITIGVIYVGLMAIWLYHFYQRRAKEIAEGKLLTVVGKDSPHLYWPFVKDLNGWAGISWFTIFFLALILGRDLIFLAVASIGLIYSIYRESYNGTYTSLWCNYSNVIWIYVILWVAAKKLRIQPLVRLFSKLAA